MGTSSPSWFHQSLWHLLVPKIIHPIAEQKICKKCVVFAARFEGSGLEEGNLSVPLSSARDTAHSSVLAYRACLWSMPTQIKLPNVTDGVCLVCMFTVVCCVPTWSNWKSRAIGKDSRGWVLFWGECSRSGRRTVRAAWEAAAHCDRDHPEDHEQEPETTKGTSMGSEETGKVWRNPESHRAFPSNSYKQGSLSKVAMRRGEICLENCFIFTLFDVVTQNFFAT